jgi:Kdo2-lipid IVA lauroyltransferase/acyltransferase
MPDARRAGSIPAMTAREADWLEPQEQARRPRPTVAHLAEAGGAALFFALFGALPLDRASALGGALARRLGPRLGVSQTARRNVRLALPDLGEPEIERILAGMWDNLGRVAAEYPHLRRIRVFEPRGPVETQGREHIEAAAKAGRRMIFVSGHLGNWEIATMAAQQLGVPIVQIYRAANNPLIDRMIARFRGGAGGLIPKGPRAARRAVAALRRGGHVALLVDQKMNEGLPIAFFGRPAMTPPALAFLALRFDCEVLPVRVERLAGARFRLTVFPPLPVTRSGDFAEDGARLLAQVNALLEAWIRDRPEQWLWLHRRWPD